MENTMVQCPTDHELQALLEQTLAPTALRTLESHIADCDQCQQRMDALTSTDDLVFGSQELSSVPAAVLAKLRETPHGHTSTVPNTPSAFGHGEQRPIIPGFDIHEHIASGASGALYRATDQQLGRLVAVKVMHSSVARSKSARHRLQREARAVAAVHHPHVVAVHSTGEDDQHRPYMVMELIDGLSITQHLAQHGAFLPKTAATIIEQSARGLAAAHTSGLIHRDVKSSNILIERSGGTAKVVDFGLVREDTQETQLTMDGMLAGTPAYISPEQIVDPTTVDGRTDVYSLGIVLYEMLTGTVPFRGVVRMTLQQVQHSEPQPPRQLNDAIPRDLQTICLRAIEKDPDRRYPSAEDFGDDLQRFLNNQPIVARPAGRVEKSWRWCQRNRRVALLSGLVILAVLSTVGVTAASAYRLSLAGQEVQEADTAARSNADALVVQRDAAMETVRKLVFEVPPMLQELRDDTSEVEKTILKIALKGLDQVGQSAEVSGEVDYNTANALRQLGYALYVAGEFDDSEIQLQRCLELIRKMTSTGEPIDVTAPLESEVYLTLAEIDIAMDEPGSEQKHLQAAIDVARAWTQKQPENVEAAAALAMSLGLIGDSHAVEGSSTHANDSYQEARELLEAALRHDPDNENVSAKLEDLQESIDYWGENVRDPEADRLKRILQTEVESAETLYATNPENQTSKTALVSALLRFARFHTWLGNPDRTESICNRAKSMFDDDASPPPLMLLKIDRHLGDGYLRGGRTKLARNTFRVASEAAEQLLADHPDDSIVREEISFCRLGLADAYSQQANGAKARPLYQQVLQDYSDSTELTPRHRMLVCEARIGLAWSAFYEEENATATDLLSALQSEFETLCSDLTTANQVGELAFVNAWIDETSLDLESLRDVLEAESR